MSAASRAVVIGGGVAGLATAALLAREGHEVTLLEARADVGGRAGSWERDGFRFDTGPSWYLMPEVFDHFYRLMGTSAAEQLDLVPLDPAYRVFFEGHDEPLVVRAERAANLAAFEHIETGAGAALDRYLDSAAEIYDLALDEFLYSTLPPAKLARQRSVLRSAGRLARLLLQPLDPFIRRFVRDQRLRQVLGYPAVFLGTSPFTAPSLYHLMSRLDLDGGVLYPAGGFVELVNSLRRVAEQAGVRILTRSEATQLVTTRGTGGDGAKPRVAAVRYSSLDWQVELELPADLVVVAGDLADLDPRLLPRELQQYPTEWWDDRVAGPSAVLAFLGVRGALPELEHHNLFFADDWRGSFDRIFTAPTSIPDPASIYVCRTSATDPGTAPADHENLFVLIPVPADPSLGAGGEHGAGDATIEAAADAAIRTIAMQAGIPDLADRIVLRRTVGPADFEREFRAWKGTALGPAHTLKQSAFFRGSTVNSRVDGVYYAGASTVPGIGLPMCLISAELVIKRLRGDISAGPLGEPARGLAASVAPAPPAAPAAPVLPTSPATPVAEPR